MHATPHLLMYGVVGYVLCLQCVNLSRRITNHRGIGLLSSGHASCNCVYDVCPHMVVLADAISRVCDVKLRSCNVWFRFVRHACHVSVWCVIALSSRVPWMPNLSGRRRSTMRFACCIPIQWPWLRSRGRGT